MSLYKQIRECKEVSYRVWKRATELKAKGQNPLTDEEILKLCKSCTL